VPAEEPQDQAEEVLVIDGEEYEFGDATFTFREIREVRKLVRALLDDDEILNPFEAPLTEVLPALVTVIKRREDPEYSLETALDLRYEEVLRPRKAVQPKTSGATGARKTSSTAA